MCGNKKGLHETDWKEAEGQREEKFQGNAVFNNRMGVDEVHEYYIAGGRGAAMCH